MLFVACVLLCSLAVQATTHIKGYSAGADSEGLPKQYLVWDDDDTYLLFDTGDGSSTDGIINFIEENGGRHLRAIFITGPEPELYGGVPDLADEYPSAFVTVTNYDIYDALIAAAGNLGNYNWAANVRVLSDDDTLDEVEVLYYDDFPATRSNAYSVFASKVQNWVITGEALYVAAHPYLGEPLNTTNIQNWYNVLEDFTSGGRLGFDKNTVFYSSYNRAGSQSSVSEFIGYLQEFENKLTFCVADRFLAGLDQISEDLIADYPTWVNSDVLTAMTENPAWQAVQDAAPVCPYYYTPGMYSYSLYNNAGMLSFSVFTVVVALFLAL